MPNRYSRWNLAQLQALAEELSIAEHVRSVGKRSQGRLAQMFPAASVVLSPHTGRAVAEAAFGGGPVNAYDVDRQSELIENEVTGMRVGYCDKDAMAAGVDRFLSEPLFARRMRDAHCRRAVELLDPERVNAHERAEYTKLLATTR